MDMFLKFEGMIDKSNDYKKSKKDSVKMKWLKRIECNN